MANLGTQYEDWNQYKVSGNGGESPIAAYLVQKTGLEDWLNGVGIKKDEKGKWGYQKSQGSVPTSMSNAVPPSTPGVVPNTYAEPTPAPQIQQKPIEQPSGMDIIHQGMPDKLGTPISATNGYELPKFTQGYGLGNDDSSSKGSNMLSGISNIMSLFA